MDAVHRGDIRTGGPLPEGSWNRATECPGWSVRDIVSHVIAVESELLGDPRPIHSLPRDLLHVTTDAARYLELPVDKRRCHTALEMTGELDYTIIRRSRALRNAKQLPNEPVRWPAGPQSRDIPYHELLRLRAFDVWVHEQDLRRALGTPGNLDSPAALVARDVLLQGLPKVVANRAAPWPAAPWSSTSPARSSSCAPSGSTPPAAAAWTSPSAWPPTSSSPSTGRPTSASPAAAAAPAR